jgi:tetratricopeptide (TPR) repeat protein
LARIAQAGESTLSSDMLLGTPQYISPEQARGEKDLDVGTDVYSLGVVIYEMVVGRVPFNADTPYSIVHDHIYTPLPMPRAVNPRVPEAMERVLLKALAKDHTDRYPSVAALVQAVQGALNGEAPPVAEHDTAAAVQVEDAEEALSPAGRRRWIWVAGGLALACFCLFGFLVVVNRSNKAGISATASQAVQQTSAGPASSAAATLAAARQAVATNPADPDAQLALARSLAEDGQPGRAWLALQAGAQLLRDRGQPARAAQALAAGLELMGGPSAADPALVDATLQALFLGAAKPDQETTILDRLQAEYPDWPQLDAVAARAALHAGELDSAQALSQQALEAAPDDPIARAVGADIDARSGDQPKARSTIDDILSQGEVPRWLQVFLTELRRGLSTTS